MKGTLIKYTDGWKIIFEGRRNLTSLPLHPDSITELSILSDKKLEDRVGDNVDFEVVEELTDDITIYAKLINQVSDNEKVIKDNENDIHFGDLRNVDIDSFMAGYKKAKENLYTEEDELCINCDEKKITHNICMDCIGMLIKYNQVSDTRKMVEDDADKIMDLAEESRNKLNDVVGLCSGEIEDNIFDMGFYSGYNKAKESLYTEEQVREAYEYGSNASLGVSKTSLIQSLKK
jgi:ribosomal protein L32